MLSPFSRDVQCVTGKRAVGGTKCFNPDTIFPFKSGQVEACNYPKGCKDRVVSPKDRTVYNNYPALGYGSYRPKSPRLLASPFPALPYPRLSYPYPSPVRVCTPGKKSPYYKKNTCQRGDDPYFDYSGVPWQRCNYPGNCNWGLKRYQPARSYLGPNYDSDSDEEAYYPPLPYRQLPYPANNDGDKIFLYNSLKLEPSAIDFINGLDSGDNIIDEVRNKPEDHKVKVNYVCQKMGCDKPQLNLKYSDGSNALRILKILKTLYVLVNISDPRQKPNLLAIAKSIAADEGSQMKITLEDAIGRLQAPVGQ